MSSSPSPSCDVVYLPRSWDDLHLHIRDTTPILSSTLAHLFPSTALEDPTIQPISALRRALIMPNIIPPVTNAERLSEYHQRILQTLTTLKQAKIKSSSPTPSYDTSYFEPLMSLYLTDDTTADMISEAYKTGLLKACKLYPQGATTHSHFGVKSMQNIIPALQKMAELGVLLLIHGESIEPTCDIFDREREFLQTQLEPVLTQVKGLKVVLEHITTKEAAHYVRTYHEEKRYEKTQTYLAATITPHHLLCNRNMLFQGGINPHYYCLPILKREEHRQALVEAATSGLPCFFAGTDSAPHPKHAKEAAKGCAGCFTAPFALELYLETFDKANKIDKFVPFISEFGAKFYGLPLNPDVKHGQLKLVREKWTIPSELPYGENGVIVPFRAGEQLQWKLYVNQE